MKQILGIAMLAGGGYFLLKALGIDPLSLLHLGGAAGNSAETTGTQQAINPNSAQQDSTKAKVIAAAKVDGIDVNAYQTPDTWGYYYQKVRGSSQPAPEDMFPGRPRDTKYSVDEWWAAATKSGLSGLGNIAHYVNPYWNVQGTPYGSNLAPSGFEKFIVRKGR